MHLAPALNDEARSKQIFVGSKPWLNSWRLARMRSIAPVFGTPESSSLPFRSLPKSTSVENGETSPRRSWSAWVRSRHHAAWTAAPAAASPIVTPAPYWLGWGIGSCLLVRGPTLTMATPLGVPPPGWSAVGAPGLGAR